MTHNLSILVLVLFLSFPLNAEAIQAGERSNETNRVPETSTDILRIQERLSALDAKSEEIISLKESLKTRNTFSIWFSFLLGASTLIVTGIGVFIAIFSFFGYRKIITSTEDIANKVALEETKKVIASLAQKEIKNLLKDGELDQELIEASERVIYRGVQRPEQSATQSSSDSQQVDGEGEQ